MAPKAAAPAPRTKVKLTSRPLDCFLVAFFLSDVFVCCVAGLDAVLNANPAQYDSNPAIWPPTFIAKALHGFAKASDPLLYARPLWLRAMLAIRLSYALYDAFAAYCFAKGEKARGLRPLGFVYSALMIYSTVIVMTEGLLGEHAAGSTGAYLAAYVPYLVVPALIVWRLLDEEPFKRRVGRRRQD
eukprot:tig00000889_g5341.t1